MSTKLFSELGLSEELLKAIDKLGFEKASPIQADAIPVLMEGRDVVGQSQTGSGKTAAFAIPAIEKTNPQQRAVQVLILCPTRELAVQVSEEVHKLAFFKRGISALPIYGGQSYERQFWGLKQGAQIVIGTPGRVMDHMRRGTLRLETVRMVILDEVDVMLNMGFRDDIEFILQAVPKERQTVLFSATIPRPIHELIQKYTRDPQQVRIEQKAMTVPTVEQSYYEVDRRFKVELLTRLIDLHDLRLGIVFCNTKRMVDDLVDHLNAQGYSADRLHGDMTQAMRERVMNKFRKSGLEFLVATDVAARGIDVDDVQVVFNYDLPYDPEDYVHRIGRTGRAGRSGMAISFVSGRELFQIQQIERYTKMRIPRAKPPTAAEVEEARANVFLDKLRTTLQNGDFKHQDQMIERLLEEGFTSTDIISAVIHHLQLADSAPTPRPEERPQHAQTFRDDLGYSPRDGRRGDRRERFSERRDRDARPSREPFIAPRSEQPRKTQAPVEKKATAPTPAPAPTPPPAAVPAPTPKAATQPPPPPPPFKPAHITKKGQLPAKPKTSRRTPDEQTRLYINVGEEMGISSADVVSAILGETGLPAKSVGTVDVRARHLFVDVASENANAIISKLNRSQIKGQKVKVKVA